MNRWARRRCPSLRKPLLRISRKPSGRQGLSVSMVSSKNPNSYVPFAASNRGSAHSCPRTVVLGTMHPSTTKTRVCLESRLAIVSLVNWLLRRTGLVVTIGNIPPNKRYSVLPGDRAPHPLADLVGQEGGVDVPDTDGSIGAARDEPVAIRTEGHRMYPILVPLQNGGPHS